MPIHGQSASVFLYNYRSPELRLHKTINHLRAAQMSLLLTLKEPNIPWLVFKGGIDVVGNPPPVTGRQCRVTTFQMPVPDPPNVARLKEEQLSSDHRYGIKLCPASIGLEKRQIECSFPHAIICLHVKFPISEIYAAHKEVLKSCFIVWKDK